jgi:hypothetical protein
LHGRGIDLDELDTSGFGELDDLGHGPALLSVPRRAGCSECVAS